MKAVVFERHGGREVLEYKDIPEPDVSAKHVLLKIRATGLNYNDVWARRGLPGMDFAFPHVSGTDAAGTVIAVGSEVRNVAVGDAVVVSGAFSCLECFSCLKGEPFFCPDFKIWGFQTGPCQGAQAEYAKVPAANLVAKPTWLTWEEAASMPLVLVTAWRMLVSRARVGPGEFVLIWGAGGGLGTMAIQVCQLFRARVIAVAASEDKLELARELGAEFVINRTKQRVLREVQQITKRRGVDVVFEHVGNATWETSILSLRWGGRIVVCGATSGYDARVDLRFLWNKQQSYLGSHFGSTAELAEAMRFVEAKQIRPVVMDVLPLKEIRRAHEIMENDQARGKVVLVTSCLSGRFSKPQ